MSNNREALLRAVLDCGSLDLSVIDDVGMDIGEAIDYAEMNFGEINFNNVMLAVVNIAQNDFANKLDDNKDEVIEGLEDRIGEINVDIEDLEAEQSSLEDDEDEDHSERLDEIYDELRELEDEEAELQTEIDEINSLNPIEDIESYHNYLDTSAWFNNNEEVYVKHFKDLVDEFEEETGLGLT